MRIMKAILIGILLCAGVGIKAQDKIQVTSFNRMETDITARVTTPRKDQNGEVCALIRIVTTIKDLMFEPDALGIAARENKTGEIWLYVPRGARRISIMHDKFGVLRNYFYPDIIDKGTVYEMEIRVNDGSGQVAGTPVRSCSSCAPNQPRRISTLTMKRYRQRTDCLRLP